MLVNLHQLVNIKFTLKTSKYGKKRKSNPRTAQDQVFQYLYTVKCIVKPYKNLHLTGEVP